jgi:hypothetical protein
MNPRFAQALHATLMSSAILALVGCGGGGSNSSSSASSSSSSSSSSSGSSSSSSGSSSSSSSGSSSSSSSSSGSGGTSSSSSGGGSTVTLSIDNPIVPAGQGATLTWSSTTATSCSASGNWSGTKPTSGTQNVTSTAAGYYTYTLTCSGPGASPSQSVVLTAYGNTPINQLGTSQPIFYLAEIEVPTSNQIIGFTTTTVAPPLPAASSNSSAYISYWPGLEPLANGVNYLPTNGGLLQPALLVIAAAQGWGADGGYYNSNGIPPIVQGWSSPPESGGVNNFNSSNNDGINPLPGDVIAEDMVLDQTTGYWTVNLTDTTLNQSNTLIINMQGQAQNVAIFALETGYGMPLNNPVIFTNSTLTFASPDTAGICSSSLGASNNYVLTPPTLDSTGTKCSIAEVILYQN